MTDDEDLGVAACPRCLTPMQDEGSAQQVDRGDGVLVTEGTAYWRCPSCHLIVA